MYVTNDDEYERSEMLIVGGLKHDLLLQMLQDVKKIPIKLIYEPIDDEHIRLLLIFYMKIYFRQFIYMIQIM